MFTRNDPRAELLLAVHEGRVTAETRPGWTEWLVGGKEPYFAYLGQMQTDSLITFDVHAPAPAVVSLTELGGVYLAALFGIPVTVTPEDEPDEQEDDVELGAEPAGAKHSARQAVPTAAAPDDTTEMPDSDGVTIDYFGLGPECLDFVNGKEFRDAVRKHGYELRVDRSGEGGVSLPIDQPLTGDNNYLSVIDPSSHGRFYVLYDDEAWSNLESPGFSEILTLMDRYCKEQSQSRLFMAEPETDDEEDELDLWVSEGHPFYGLDFDFATGKYVRV